MIAANYPFLDVMWTMLVFFAWVIWFWLLITIFADIFRRHDIGGGTKALWIVFVIILPFLGVLIYLIAESKGMAERNQERVQAAQTQADAYIRDVASSSDPAEQIAKAKQLLDAGTISSSEFDALKPHFNVAYDAGGAVGRRYRRQDEIGTPFCITIDFQTLEDNKVTIRDRDSMDQSRFGRVPISELRGWLEAHLDY